MPTKVQQDYEEDLTQEVPAIVTLPSLVNTDKSKAIGRQIETEIDVARDILVNMQTVVNSTYGGDALASRVKKYRTELDQLAESWARARLMGGSEKWASGTQMLARTSKNIEEAKALGKESEELGDYALGKLRDDRVKLEGAALEMETLGYDVTTARSVLSAISRKIIYSKLILICVICVEFIGIGIIIFVRWIWPNIHLPPNATHS